MNEKRADVEADPQRYEPPTLEVLGTTAELTRTSILDTSECSPTTCEISDRRLKVDVEPVDVASILERVVELPVSAWTYRAGVADGGRHIGPMAQDWHAAFGVGGDTRIHHVDMNGVALAAIQALYEQVSERDRQIGELRERLAALEGRLARLGD